MAQRIAILGTGLIGGSLGLALRKHHPDRTVVGYDRPDVLDVAVERGAIDEKAADPETAVKGADLVVLATPPAVVLRMLETIADHVGPDTIVTDVASVKEAVLDQARDVLPPDVPFIGGHPMAGAEFPGIDHATPLLFENAAYALCLPDDIDDADAALETTFAPLVDLIQSIGARVLRLDAATHDRVAAVISHLPQLLAVALVNTVSSSDVRETAFELAAGGFRDMTRIAASPFSMWRDILVGNEGAVHDALSGFTREVQKLRNRLIADDLEGLGDAFDEARSTREAIPRMAKGFLTSLSDVYVQAPDRQGVVHEMTGVLLDADLDLKDIELQKFREGTGGTFRIAFESSQDAERAASLLTHEGFEAHRP